MFVHHCFSKKLKKENSFTWVENFCPFDTNQGVNGTPYENFKILLLCRWRLLRCTWTKFFKWKYWKPLVSTFPISKLSLSDTLESSRKEAEIFVRAKGIYPCLKLTKHTLLCCGKTWTLSHLLYARSLAAKAIHYICRTDPLDFTAASYSKYAEL